MTFTGTGLQGGRRLRRRRWPWIVPAGLLILAGVTALIVRLVWLPFYRPRLQPGELYGIDVSAHQGRIDWLKVVRGQVSFAYLKATEGSTYVDPEFAGNLARARSVGLTTGAYHFFTLCSPGLSQATNFLKVAPPASGMLPAAVDLELQGNCSARPSINQVEAELGAFVTKVARATGRPVIYYVGTSFDHRYPIRQVESGLRWKRRTLRRPSGPWVIWQVDGFARVNGVGGHIDLDVGKFDKLRLQS